MVNTQGSSDPALVKRYFERGLAIRSSVKDLELEFRELMKDAMADGLDQHALRSLLVLLATAPAPRPESQLVTVFEYSKCAGLELDLDFKSNRESVKSSRGHHGGRDRVAPLQALEEKRSLDKKAVLLIQVIVGLLAGSLFVWLLH